MLGQDMYRSWWGPNRLTVLVVMILVLTSTGALFAYTSGVVPRQAAPRVYRVGFLHMASHQDRHDGLVEGLRELGYVDGQNLKLERRWAEASRDRLNALYRELLDDHQVEILVAGDVPTALFLKEQNAPVPIVVAVSGDPVGVGLVESFAHPGGNITGLSTLADELAEKRFELLKELMPSMSGVAVMWNPDSGPRDTEWAQTYKAASMFDVQVIQVEITSSDDLDDALDDAVIHGAQAVIVWGDPVFGSFRRQIVQAVHARHLIDMHERPEAVSDSGGLVAYGVSLVDLFRRSASYVDRIVKGAKPANLPVERPTRFELIVNLEAASDLDITVPDRVLQQAERVLQ
jgi:putative tryptophan/tyrosine transport system substrate-binding protein